MDSFLLTRVVEYIDILREQVAGDNRLAKGHVKPGVKQTLTLDHRPDAKLPDELVPIARQSANSTATLTLSDMLKAAEAGV